MTNTDGPTHESEIGQEALLITDLELLETLQALSKVGMNGVGTEPVIEDLNLNPGVLYLYKAGLEHEGGYIALYPDSYDFNGRVRSKNESYSFQHAHELLRVLLQNKGTAFTKTDLLKHTDFYEELPRHIRYSNIATAYKRLKDDAGDTGLLHSGLTASKRWYGIGVSEYEVPPKKSHAQTKSMGQVVNIGGPETGGKQATIETTRAPKAKASRRTSNVPTTQDQKAADVGPAPWRSFLTLPLTPIEREVASYFQQKKADTIEIQDMAANAANMLIPVYKLQKIIEGMNSKAQQQGIKTRLVVNKVVIRGEERTFVELVD